MARWLAPAFLFLLSVYLHRGTLGGEFIWDDRLAVVRIETCANTCISQAVCNVENTGRGVTSDAMRGCIRNVIIAFVYQGCARSSIIVSTIKDFSRCFLVSSMTSSASPNVNLDVYL